MKPDITFSPFGIKGNGVCFSTDHGKNSDSVGGMHLQVYMKAKCTEDTFK